MCAKWSISMAWPGPASPSGPHMVNECALHAWTHGLALSRKAPHRITCHKTLRQICKHIRTRVLHTAIPVVKRKKKGGKKSNKYISISYRISALSCCLIRFHSGLFLLYSVNIAWNCRVIYPTRITHKFTANRLRPIMTPMNPWFHTSCEEETTTDTMLYSLIPTMNRWVEGNVIACWNASEVDIQFCWAGDFCVASLLRRAVMQSFWVPVSVRVGLEVVQKRRRGGRDIVQWPDILLQDQTLCACPPCLAGEMWSMPAWNKITFLLSVLSHGSTFLLTANRSAVLKGLQSLLMAREKLHKFKDAHIVYSCTNMHSCHCQLCFLVDVLSVANLDKQRAPLWGCSVMRGSLIVNTLPSRVFHFTAGQKGQAIKFRSSGAFT